jgi:hypothetical protein
MCLDVIMIWFAPTTLSCCLLIGCGCVLAGSYRLKMVDDRV